MIRVVFLKELIDHLRDRRSVLGSFVLPALGPLLLLGIFQLLSTLSAERELRIPVIGAEHAPRLVAYLEANGAEILPPPLSPEDSVRRGDADLVMVIDEDYRARFELGRSSGVRLIVDQSQNEAHQSVRRVERLLFAYAQTLGALRMMARGLSPEVATPLEIEEHDLATPEKLAANLLSVVPLILMLAALVSGMNVAIDTTAGERERGSLEALLLNPVPRSSLVAGKWLATSLASLVVATVTLLGFMVTVRYLPFEELGIKVRLGPYEALVMWAAIAPLALFGSGLQMLIATFARSFKEAQTYLNLLNLLPMAPSVLLMFDPARTASWMLPLPTLAQVGTVVNVMRGEDVPGWHLGVIALSSLAYAALCLFLLVRLLHREQIIFGRP